MRVPELIHLLPTEERNRCWSTVKHLFPRTNFIRSQRTLRPEISMSGKATYQELPLCDGTLLAAANT